MQDTTGPPRMGFPWLRFPGTSPTYPTAAAGRIDPTGPALLRERLFPGIAEAFLATGVPEMTGHSA